MHLRRVAAKQIMYQLPYFGFASRRAVHVDDVRSVALRATVLTAFRLPLCMIFAMSFRLKLRPRAYPPLEVGWNYITFSLPCV